MEELHRWRSWIDSAVRPEENARHADEESHVLLNHLGLAQDAKGAMKASLTRPARKKTEHGAFCDEQRDRHVHDESHASIWNMHSQHLALPSERRAREKNTQLHVLLTRNHDIPISCTSVPMNPCDRLMEETESAQRSVPGKTWQTSPRRRLHHRIDERVPSTLKETDSHRPRRNFPSEQAAHAHLSCIQAAHEERHR